MLQWLEYCRGHSELPKKLHWSLCHASTFRQSVALGEALPRALRRNWLPSSLVKIPGLPSALSKPNDFEPKLQLVYAHEDTCPHIDECGIDTLLKLLAGRALVLCWSLADGWGAAVKGGDGEGQDDWGEIDWEALTSPTNPNLPDPPPRLTPPPPTRQAAGRCASARLFDLRPGDALLMPAGSAPLPRTLCAPRAWHPPARSRRARVGRHLPLCVHGRDQAGARLRLHERAGLGAARRGDRAPREAGQGQAGRAARGRAAAQPAAARPARRLEPSCFARVFHLARALLLRVLTPAPPRAGLALEARDLLLDPAPPPPHRVAELRTLLDIPGLQPDQLHRAAAEHVMLIDERLKHAAGGAAGVDRGSWWGRVCAWAAQRKTHFPDVGPWSASRCLSKEPCVVSKEGARTFAEIIGLTACLTDGGLVRVVRADEAKDLALVANKRAQDLIAHERRCALAESEGQAPPLASPRVKEVLDQARAPAVYVRASCSGLRKPPKPHAPPHHPLPLQVEFYVPGSALVRGLTQNDHQVTNNPVGLASSF